MRKGNLFVISGPSGVGKGTLVALLQTALPDVCVSISATTRQPREGEIDGVHYHFISDERFDELVAQDGFLEWAAYNTDRYGSPRAFVEQNMAEGKQVILEIDIQGGFQVREKHPEAHLVFIEPPSLAALEQRLRARGTETEEQIKMRLERAELELSRKMEYDTRFVNDQLDETLHQLIAYVDSFAEQ